MDKLQYVMDLMHRDCCSTNSADYATESILLFRNELDRIFCRIFSMKSI